VVDVVFCQDQIVDTVQAVNLSPDQSLVGLQKSLLTFQTAQPVANAQIIHLAGHRRGAVPGLPSARHTVHVDAFQGVHFVVQSGTLAADD